MLNPLFLNQLIFTKPDLYEEILQILQANNGPMTCKEIFDKSEVATTSRDVSLEMQQKLKAHGMVEIDRKVRRPGTGAEVAYWKITPAGVGYLNDKQPSDMRDESKFRTSLAAIPDSDFEVEKPQQPAAIESEKTMTTQAESNTKEIKLSDVLNFVILKPGHLRSAVITAIAGDNPENMHKVRKIISNAIGRQQLEFKNMSLHVGPKMNDWLKKENNRKKTVVKDPISEVAKQPVRPTDADLRSINTDLCKKHTDAPSKSTLNNVSNTVKPVFKAPTQQDIKQPFRVAYTSDGCLIIMGLQDIAIELDAEQTRELINYVDDMKLSEVA